MNAELTARAESLLQKCREAGVMLVSAESCTGGLIAAYLTEVPGSSDVFERGFVTYSNTAKSEQLGVPVSLIATKGAVSEEVARAMAEGALAHSHAHIAVAVTGVAGPDGGTPDKPIGLVHVSVAMLGGETIHRRCTYGDVGRSAIRTATVEDAFSLIESRLG